MMNFVEEFFSFPITGNSFDQSLNINKFIVYILAYNLILTNLYYATWRTNLVLLSHRSRLSLAYCCKRDIITLEVKQKYVELINGKYPDHYYFFIDGYYVDKEKACFAVITDSRHYFNLHKWTTGNRDLYWKS